MGKGKSVSLAVSAAFVLLALLVAPLAGALELRVATWNLEHLDDMNGAAH